MSLYFPRKVYKNFIHSFPILLLFFLALTGYDLSFFLFKINFSFNFIYIAIRKKAQSYNKFGTSVLDLMNNAIEQSNKKLMDETPIGKF